MSTSFTLHLSKTKIDDLPYARCIHLIRYIFDTVYIYSDISEISVYRYD